MVCSTIEAMLIVINISVHAPYIPEKAMNTLERNTGRLEDWKCTDCRNKATEGSTSVLTLDKLQNLKLCHGVCRYNM